MDGLSAAASIIAVAQMTGAVIGYLESVKDAEKQRKRLHDELWALYGILTMLENKSKAGHEECWHQTLRSLDAPNGPLQQLKEALKKLSTRLAPREGPRKLSKVLKWPFKDNEIKDIFFTIERQKGLLLLARQNDHVELTRAIKDGIEGNSKQLADIGLSLTETRLDDSHDKIHRWLSPPDPSTNYQNALTLRYLGTGSWLLENPIYLRWRARAGPLLWLHGIPGCGKTILSSTVLQDILGHCNNNPKIMVLYFYFDFNEGKKQENGAMVRSFIDQLRECKMNIPESLDSLYRFCGNGAHQPSPDHLMATLHSMMKTFDDVYIIMDALDESNDRLELLECIEKIADWKDVPLHILATSRRESDIEDSLQPLCSVESSISIQTAIVNQDIRQYVHDRLRADRRFRRWQSQTQIQQEIANHLARKAGGMFRWAVCQLDSLSKCLTIHQLRNELNSLPKDLDETYERILGSIEQIYRPSAIKMLNWLAFSARPLTLEEVAEVVTIDIDDSPRIDPEKRLQHPRDVLLICSSLVTLGAEEVEPNCYDESISDGESSQTDNHSKKCYIYHREYDQTRYNVTRDHSVVIRLAHLSVKEFLISERIQHSTASEFSIREVDANVVIAIDCLAYLLQFESTDCFADQPGTGSGSPNVSEPQPLKNKSQYPLALYAARYWSGPARIAEASENGTVSVTCLELLLANGAQVSNWVRLCSPSPLRTLGLELWRFGFPHGNEDEDDSIHRILKSPIYCASLFGLSQVTALLLSQGYNTDGSLEGFQAFSPLFAACYSCSLSTVKVLLDYGAAIEFGTGSDVGNPLYAASYQGNIAIVEELISRGAGVNAQSGLYHDALNIASHRGHIDVVRLLIEKGACLKTTSRNVLLSAIDRYDSPVNIDLVQLLIDQGADIHGYGTDEIPLDVAASKNAYAVAQLLLQKGVDVNTPSREGITALMTASFHGHRDMVRLLLDNGADITVQGGALGHALNHAAIRGRSEIVQQLLHSGAEINAICGDFGTALQTSSCSANISSETAKVLLRNGADVNAYGGRYGSALETTRRKGKGYVKGILLESGAKELSEIEAELIAKGEEERVLLERSRRESGYYD